jgi:phosphatidylinositol dimannoside acyltransferase
VQEEGPAAPGDGDELPSGGRGGLKAAATVRGYQAGAAVARSLPGPVATAVTGLVGAGIMIGGGERRTMIQRHLRRIHGRHVSDRDIRKEARRAFVSYARYWLESFRLTGATPESLDRHMTTEGLERLDEARARGRGVIVAMPHIGGWDFGGAWLATHGYPISVVAEALEPAELFEWFVEFRRALGIEVVPLGPDAGRAMLAALKRNDVVGLLCDRDIAGGGVEVEFFGERTTVPGGPATLALRTGAALLPTAVYFTGRHGHRGVVRPAVPAERQGRLRDDVERVTQDLVRELESLIRMAPHQWHVFQPVWPSDRRDPA